eukprot:2577368-Prymnesium_polylepis.2
MARQPLPRVGASAAAADKYGAARWAHCVIKGASTEFGFERELSGWAHRLVKEFALVGRGLLRLINDEWQPEPKRRARELLHVDGHVVKLTLLRQGRACEGLVGNRVGSVEQAHRRLSARDSM